MTHKLGGMGSQGAAKWLPGEAVRKGFQEILLRRGCQGRPSGEAVRIGCQERLSGESVRRGCQERLSGSGEAVRRGCQEKLSEGPVRRGCQGRLPGEAVRWEAVRRQSGDCY